MQWIPRGRFAWTRFVILLIALALVAFQLNIFALARLFTYQPRDGDLIFQSLPHNELVDVIEGASGSPFSHCGIVMNVNGSWMVHEAIGEVRSTWLPLWILRGRGGAFTALRLRDAPEGGALARWRTEITNTLGKRYDYNFSPDDREYYCSELITKTARLALGIDLGEWKPLRELRWQPFETAIRRFSGGELPLDRLIVTPASIARSPRLVEVVAFK